MNSFDRTFADILLGRQQLEADWYDLCEAEGLLPVTPKVAPGLENRHRQFVHQAVAAELAHSRIVVRALSALSEAGVDVLVIKGTALAYLLYESPWQRSRNDTDLLIRQSDLARAKEVLAALGYEPNESLPGLLVMGELAFQFEDEVGLGHTLDLHWRLNNSWRLANLIAFDDLWENRIAIPRLGSSAWTCAYEYSLLISAIHRVSHLRYLAYESGELHRMESDFTLWTYDVHLLSAGLGDENWQWVLEIAVERKMALLLADILERSIALFQTGLPDHVMPQLLAASDQITIESMNSVVSADWQNFMALPNWSFRIRWLGQQLFPSPDYMRQKYGSERSLVLCYIRRILIGFSRRARRMSS